jgi:hypothetical protein
VPSGSAEGFIQRVRALPLPGRVLSVIAPLLALMRPLNQQLAYSDATIEHLAVQDPRVLRLRSVPSVGPASPWNAREPRASRSSPAPVDAQHLGGCVKPIGNDLKGSTIEFKAGRDLSPVSAPKLLSAA